MPRPTALDIKEQLDELREFIDSTNDIIAARIAYAVETAIRWTQENTTDWPTLLNDVKSNSAILHQEKDDDSRD